MADEAVPRSVLDLEADYLGALRVVADCLRAEAEAIVALSDAELRRFEERRRTGAVSVDTERARVRAMLVHTEAVRVRDGALFSAQQLRDQHLHGFSAEGA